MMAMNNALPVERTQGLEKQGALKPPAKGQQGLFFYLKEHAAH